MNPNIYANCVLCPRMCRADRRFRPGRCGCRRQLKAARAALHHWEEPSISGTKGSGTVFFTGCTLGCCFCQNYPISHEGYGEELTARDLARIFLRLQDQGAHNLNLVTPTQFLPDVLAALDLARPHLSIPVVYNCGGYERPEIIRLLKGYVDIFLPDLKYMSAELSARYSDAADYFAWASAAIPEMIAQTGPPVFDPHTGLMQSGVIIRHLLLPGAKEDSLRLLRWMRRTLPHGAFQLSLLSQYTPLFHADRYPEINRRITTYEYDKVVDEAIALGLTAGYMQKRSSAKAEYTPPFDLEGLPSRTSS